MNRWGKKQKYKSWSKGSLKLFNVNFILQTQILVVFKK